MSHKNSIHCFKRLSVLDKTALLDLGDLVAHADPRHDEYLLNPEAADDDASDVEDVIIKPNDNLILVGHIEGEASLLEVYGNFDKLFCHFGLS